VRSVPSPRRRRLPRFDGLSLAVAPVGIVLVVVSQLLDGSPLAALVQGPSALIVFGGTLGAVLISFTPTEIAGAVRAAVAAFRVADDDLDSLAATLVTMSIRAHRRGLVTLEREIEDVADPLLRSGLTLVVDGVAPEVLDRVMSLESRAREAEDEVPARIFEAAAGYAPTMGILGAVLGLMGVMQNLSAPGTLGSGIALAFVATVYGVGAANLVLLPISGRLRERALLRARRRELIVQGLRILHQRMNPRLVAQTLRAFSARMPRIDELAAHLPVQIQRRASGMPS
jgi:chemotaxis protein MotA